MISNNPKITNGMPIIAPTIEKVSNKPIAINAIPTATPISIPVMLKMKQISHQTMRNGNSNIFIPTTPFHSSF